MCLRQRLAENSDSNMMETKVSESNAVSGTTQVLNEATTKLVTRHMAKDIPGGLLAASKVGYDQSSIYEFLAKPVLLNTISWAAQAAGATLINHSLPADAFSSAVYANKLQGFLSFRGTTVLRLQVNGNKFQAGRLLMVFIPQGNVPASWPGGRVRSLKAATQLPRVELDLATETEVVMEIPYISPTPYYNFFDDTGPIGRVYVLVYSPLATGSGSTSVNVSLWINFKDVELEAPAVAQMADRKPRKGSHPSEEELDAYGDKPISRGLKNLASAASSFAKIPMLSSVATPAAWALNCLSGAAAAFGYSKPGTETATTKVMVLHNFNSANHNGVDMYPNLGLDATNKMSIMPGYAGSDVDEMALSHLFQIPAYATVLTMATDTVPGTSLWSVQVNPKLGSSTSVVNLWSTQDMTPLGYFSSFFEFWRGSITFTFKIVKTQFHSGRILIAYNPAGIAPSLTQTDFLLREIIDIRETNEFRFVIPYTTTYQYLQTGGFDLSSGDSIGYLRVFVLNELVAPDTVANSIKILVEVSGGPDFEVALPKPHSVAPIFVSTWASQMNDIVPSVSNSSRVDRNQDAVAIGSAVVEHQELDPALYCIGERVNSILQLMKRYTILQYFGMLSDLKYGWDYRCFTYGAVESSAPVGLSTVPSFDYISMFGPCFAYSRGSVRMMFVSLSDGSISDPLPTVIARPSNNTAVLTDNGSMFFRPCTASNWQPAGGYALAGATIPAYQQLHCRLNRPSTTGLPEPVDVYTSKMRVGANAAVATDPTHLTMYRAAGDDFGLGYFLGVPLITTSLSF